MSPSFYFEALFTYKQFTNNIESQSVFNSSGIQVGTASLGYDSDNNHIVIVDLLMGPITAKYTYSYGINLLNNNTPTFFNVLSYVFTNNNNSINVNEIKFKMDIDTTTNSVIQAFSVSA